MSTLESTTAATLDLSASFASIIRSHMAVHVGGELSQKVYDSAEVSTAVEVEETVATVEVEESVEVTEAPRPAGPVRPVLLPVSETAVEDEVEAVEVDTEEVVADEMSDALPVHELAASEETLDMPVDAVSTDTATEEDEDDLDLDFDVSAYLTSTPVDADISTIAAEHVANENTDEDQVEESITEHSVEVIDEPVEETAVEDDDPDLEGFNPMKYLSGGAGGASQPAKKVEETPAQADVAVVAARQADPMSLLRELSSLTR